MHWVDEAIIVAVRPHGETSAIAELLTSQKGRHLGLVRGGRSKRLRPVLQLGNLVRAEWRARLDEHLGAFNLELEAPFGSAYFDNPTALSGIASLCHLVCQLAERDPHPGLYQGLKFILSHMDNPKIWIGLNVRWELELLQELGFGLDLTRCAATGDIEDLIYVSPKSACAVSRKAGAPYHDKLLPLPSYLTGEASEEIAAQDVIAGLKLTQYFLIKHIYEPLEQDLPEVRQRLLGYAEKELLITH